MSAELAPGQRVGRYQLLFRLGKGGMGEVWAAAQVQAALGFSKLVALKVLQTRDLASNAAVMFFDEAKAASALQHAAIVATTDLGQDGDNLYIAMDLVQGPSLTALLQRLVLTQRRMTPAMVAFIGQQLSSALHYAHDRAMVNGQALRLVHRDVSPHNVLLDLNGAVRLTDFGVARTAIQDHESRVGTVRGKPSYMAPEQVVGADVDGRTDVFALGIVLYECSALKRLFGRSQPVKSMDAVLKHRPKPVPDIVPDFPQTLWAVIRKALHKEPKDRFQSAAELNDALSAAAQSLPGTDRASRDLVALVRASFDEHAFDTDARVKEAIAQAAPPEEEAEPTTNHRSPAGRPRPEVRVMPAPAEPIAWPSADASDPLAPEALEEAATRYQAAPVMVPMASMGSMDALPQSTNQSYSAVVLEPRRSSRWPMVAVLIAAAALCGTAAFVIASRPSSSVLPAQSPPREAPQAAAVPTPTPTPTPRAPTPRPVAAPEAPEPEEAPSERRTERAPRRAARPAPAKAPKAPAAPADATFREVRTLITQVRAIDDKRGEKLFITLLEAGRNNTPKLNQLRREAQQILSETK